MNYISTRGKDISVKPSEAILKGIADDGGLFMPEIIPQFDFRLEDMKGRTYQELAYEIMKLYFTDFSEEELRDCILKAYATFDTEEIAPLTYAGGAYYIELFHGRTIAFKDVALSILPHLMTVSARKNDVKEKIIILTATSGDTGKAAMEGFADVPGTGIIVFYPKGGVSTIQELQMRTQEGDNTAAVAVHGNFDDAQTGVKNVFADGTFREELKKKGVILSSANSINIGRLVPQIVYYVYSYVKLLESGKIGTGEKINICVPTGNFGNILAAYLAKKMGLPVDRLICASNDNKVLYDFFRTGSYDKNRKFMLTTSPSMDILVSSNLERLIWLSCDKNAELTGELMNKLKSEGRYEISDKMQEFISDFYGETASEREVSERIRDLYKDTGYMIDTHTAVASKAYEKYVKDTGDKKVTVIASTASPYKFGKAVIAAVSGDETAEALEKDGVFALVNEINRLSRTEIPNAVEKLKTAKIRHNDECDIDELEKTISDIIERF